MATSSASKDFSVVVLASDLGIDARPFLSLPEAAEAEENWHDCPSLLPSAYYFSDLDVFQFFRLESGCDKSGYRIFRIVGKYFPVKFLLLTYKGLFFVICYSILEKSRSHVIPGERLKKYVFHKISTEMPDGPFCIVYIHSTVQKDDNSPGITVLRWIYEELPDDCKHRLQIVYFIHPGLRSRLVFATLGRFLLSKCLCWKIKYISRLQYLWQNIKKEDIEIPEFVQEHYKILEHRPLTDYGIEPDPFHLTEVPSTSYSFGRYESGWSSREYMS